jgi:hypothetical protein
MASCRHMTCLGKPRACRHPSHQQTFSSYRGLSRERVLFTQYDFPLNISGMGKKRKHASTITLHPQGKKPRVMWKERHRHNSMEAIQVDRAGAEERRVRHGRQFKDASRLDRDARRCLEEAPACYAKTILPRLAWAVGNAERRKAMVFINRKQNRDLLCFLWSVNKKCLSDDERKYADRAIRSRAKALQLQLPLRHIRVSLPWLGGGLIGIRLLWRPTRWLGLCSPRD